MCGTISNIFEYLSISETFIKYREEVTIIILSIFLVALFGTFELVKANMKHKARREEIKLLKGSGIEHVVISDDHIEFWKKRNGQSTRL